MLYNSIANMKKTALLYARALRVNQWIKNFVVFTAILFSGKLFDPFLFQQTLYTFFVFCLLSSTSYLLNDIIDYQYDRRHPIKKFRPLASGQISIQQATFLVFILTLVSLILSLLFSLSLFVLSLFFLLLHFLYSLYLKKIPTVDIFSISLSFMLRTFAGEVATGFHVPIWLLLTIFFGSLFMASVKRQAELIVHGKETRISLETYKQHYLDFLTYIFATATILAYGNYTYVEKPPQVSTIFTQFVNNVLPTFEARKWMMMTIPFVVYGVVRYAQLLYEREEGERPEKIITQDKPLIFVIGFWALMVIMLIYIL